MTKRKSSEDQQSAPIQELPVSLRKLAQKFEELDQFKVASDLAHDAKALCEMAWTGSLCEGELKRKIPLSEAIKGSTNALEAAKTEFISSYSRQMWLMVGDAFDMTKFCNDVLVAFDNLKNLKFEDLGLVHFDHLQAALVEHEKVWCNIQQKDEVFVVLQFCLRMTDMAHSFKKRTGQSIESTTVTSDQDEPRELLIYDAAAGRIYGGPNWSQFGEGPFDWARLFGPKEDDNNNDEDDGPWLTPRMAARLHHYAVYLGDTMIWNWEECQLAPKLPKIARPFFKKSQEWRESFRECHLRIAMRLEKGLPPTPNCTGEELAFHNILEMASDGEDMDDIFDGLPEFNNDDNYRLVGELAVLDEDVLMLYENGDIGYSCSEDDDEEEGKMTSFLLSGRSQRMHVVHIHPSEWFHAFKKDDFTNHLPAVAT